MVEDEAFIRDIYKRELDLAGFTTDAATNGREAMELLGKQSYDLVLLETALPDTEDLEVLKVIKGQEKTKGVVVVMLTNLGQERIVQEGFKLGAEGYLIKASLTPSLVVQEVKNILSVKELKPTATA